MSWFWKTTLYMNGMKSRTFFLFFCRATSLQINWSKSSFHYSNLFDQTLFQLHLLFPHTFTNMSESFNYFGYFMKANSCRIVDWNWLLEKVKKWIGNWCNRWLSLDGRYTLLKSSMEGQPVYWMALAALLLTVLHKLRKLSFNFLWSGCSTIPRLHLSSWDTIAKPKHKGGWSLRNIFFFNLRLVANTLWRVLTTTQIWHSVIMDKYLPFTTVAWLRSPPSIPIPPLTLGET